jgi:peroxiredoxin (alkyl hydroperoxide reductase subunit C)
MNEVHSDQCDCATCDDCAIEGVRIGSVVPDISLTVFDPLQKKEREIKLSEYRDKWLVLFFYPADFTFVCPTELNDLADYYDEFIKEGADVLSSSTDTTYVHKAWWESSEIIKKIRFPMVADTTKELADLFGVVMDNGLSLRGTFIIDPDGVLKTAHVHDTGIGRNTEELLRILRAAKFVREHSGKVCPANWKPGNDGLSTDFGLVGKPTL